MGGSEGIPLHATPLTFSSAWLLFAQPFEVERHLALVGGFEAAEFEDEGFELAVQVAHTPAFGYVLAGRYDRERQQLQEVGPAKLSHQ